MASFSAQELITEITGYRQLAAAEKDGLVVTPEIIEGLELVSELARVYRRHFSRERVRIEIAPGSVGVRFASDRTLLTRVLSNMLKNAAEATSPDNIVTVGCSASAEHVEFTVNNFSVMSDGDPNADVSSLILHEGHGARPRHV